MDNFLTINKALAGFVLTLSVVATSWGALGTLPALSPDEAQARLEELQHIPLGRKKVEVTPTMSLDCIHSDLNLPVVDYVTKKTITKKMELIQPIEGGARPVVIVVPTIIGTSILEYNLASNLCVQGASVVIADITDTTMPAKMPAWEIHDQNTVRSVHTLRTLVDYLSREASFDKTRIGALGLSAGGVVVSLFSMVEPRVVAVVLGATGGNLPGILTETEEKRISELRTRRMKEGSIPNKTSYENLLRANVKHDPLNFRNTVRSERYFQMLVTNDTYVPTPYQVELWEALGKPQRVDYNWGHKGSLVNFVMLNSGGGDLVRFFRSRLNF